MKDGDIIDGRYKVQNLLGQGGMGQVFRGHDIELNKTVAIKVLFPNTPDQVIKRFHTEAKALAKLNHPNIMTVLHFGQASNGQLYLINEFVKGDSLSSLIEKRGPQTFFDILPIFEKICRGLRYAHMEKVLHRDIKPSNVMLSENRTKEDSVKIVDFGLAKANDDDHNLTKTGASMGSPPYMSPETVHGKDTDERSDIYSLGCTLFEMMAGRPPFVGDTQFHTMMAHLNRLPPTLAEVSEKSFDEEVETFVQKFIKKNPADRFQNMDEVMAELERVKNLLLEKKRASDGLLASGVYASGAWIADKSRKMNTVMKAVVVIALISLFVSGWVVFDRVAHVSAPKSSGEGDYSQSVLDQEVRTAANEEKVDKTFEGVKQYDRGATVIRDKDSQYKVCVLSGELDRREVQIVMRDHKKMKCFQFQDLTVADHSVHFILGFPIEKVIFTSQKVTDEMLKTVGKMQELKHFRITQCGTLPPGSLDYLKPLKALPAFMTLDLDCGKDYKNPIVPFADMPKLTWVTFRNCTVTRADMKALATLKNLTMAQFKACDFAPDAIPELKAAPTCTQLAITDSHNLSPEQFQQIADLDFLMRLQMTNTNLNDAALMKFKSLKNLREFEVKNSEVSHDGADELTKLVPSINVKGGR